jgi:predicted transcriptional regulator
VGFHEAAPLRAGEGVGGLDNTLELLFSIMTAKRWEIVRTMAGAGAMSIRELARRVERDVKGVHADVQALSNCGVLHKTEDGRIIFPYSAVHIDVMVEAA